MNVFVDTSAFYAFLSATDPWHADAVRQWDRLLADPDISLVTSSFVVVETAALVRNRLGPEAEVSFLQDFLLSVTVVPVEQGTYKSAVAAVVTVKGRGASLVDQSSFAVMEEMGITYAFAYDAHFDALKYVLP